eukprot:3350663-Rhodomonas_salina.5
MHRDRKKRMHREGGREGGRERGGESESARTEIKTKASSPAKGSMSSSSPEACNDDDDDDDDDDDADDDDDDDDDDARGPIISSCAPCPIGPHSLLCPWLSTTRSIEVWTTATGCPVPKHMTCEHGKESGASAESRREYLHTSIQQPARVFRARARASRCSNGQGSHGARHLVHVRACRCRSEVCLLQTRRRLSDGSSKRRHRLRTRSGGSERSIAQQRRRSQPEAGALHIQM